MNHRDEPRLLSKTGVTAIVQRIQSMIKGGGGTSIRIDAWWSGELKWARNRISMAGERREHSVIIQRSIKGAFGRMRTNQLDDDSLIAVVRAAERDLRFQKPRLSRFTLDIPKPDLPYPESHIWSDTTYNIVSEQRGEIARGLIENAEAKGMVSAGYIEMRANEQMVSMFNDPLEHPRGNPRKQESSRDGVWTIGDRDFRRFTQSECSMTVRAPNGSASGWAGLSSYDWSAIDGKALSVRALEKCVASLNPRMIEPGRYTVILEPQATVGLLDGFVGAFSREFAERGGGPFALAYDEALDLWKTKLGLKVVDDRVTITHDPLDPQLGILPSDGLRSMTIVRKGVLESLMYPRDPYALSTLNDNLPESERFSYRMESGPTTIDEMIAGTMRGIVVTRFWGISGLDTRSLLCTGVTRDGLWLVENGRITQAIRNMRFTDSPLFVLNQIEQLGPSVPVYHPDRSDLRPVIVPPIKARDFAFTSTIDAI